MRRWGVAGAVALCFMALQVFVPAPASEPSDVPASSADAYGFSSDVVGPGNQAVSRVPFARATQESYSGAAAPAFVQAGGVESKNVPGTDIVVNVGGAAASASATTAPVASAWAQASDVRLVNQNGTPLITAQAVRARSRTDCVTTLSEGGIDLVGLKIGQAAVVLPSAEPNTEVAPEVFNPLGLRVIANEQHPAADGRGLVVNALHIYHMSPLAGPGLFTGDIVLAHAMSTVHCPNGKDTTGAQNPVVITNTVDKPVALRGDTVTYTVNVKNKSTQACTVNRFWEYAAGPFQYQSTTGAFGANASQAGRTGGGFDLMLDNSLGTIAAGATATQKFVVKVKPDAPFGTYFNNVEIFCGNLGNWVMGLAAPVEIAATRSSATTVATTTTSSTTTTTTTTVPPAAAGGATTPAATTTTFAPAPKNEARSESPLELPKTGGAWALGAGAVATAIGAALSGVRRRLP